MIQHKQRNIFLFHYSDVCLACHCRQNEILSPNCENISLHSIILNRELSFVTLVMPCKAEILVRLSLDYAILYAILLLVIKVKDILSLSIFPSIKSIILKYGRWAWLRSNIGTWSNDVRFWFHDMSITSKKIIKFHRLL